jgi:hypothetical protein
MKGRKHRETGGVNEAEEDVKDKPEARTDAKKIDAEAEEMKKGGRAHKAHGGHVEHHHHYARGGRSRGGEPDEGRGEAEYKGRKERKRGGKLVGKVDGEKPHMHAGRKPRASGGKTGSDSHPFTSARHGEDGPGRKMMKGELGFGED